MVFQLDAAINALQLLKEPMLNVVRKKQSMTLSFLQNEVLLQRRAGKHVDNDMDACF